MEVFVNLNKKTAGRDKIARLLQYLSKFLWHRLTVNNNVNADTIKILEYQLVMFRKLLRFGRCIDSLYATLPIFQQEDFTVRNTVIFSKIANSVYLLCDHILWLGRVNLCEVDTNKWFNLSQRYWLYQITLQLFRDFYEVFKIIKNEDLLMVPPQGLRDLLTIGNKALYAVQSNRPVFLDIISNSCDIFLPMTALGHVDLSASVTGILGMISSIANLMVLINPESKLSP